MMLPSAESDCKRRNAIRARPRRAVFFSNPFRRFSNEDAQSQFDLSRFLHSGRRRRDPACGQHGGVRPIGRRLPTWSRSERRSSAGNGNAQWLQSSRIGKYAGVWARRADITSNSSSVPCATQGQQGGEHGKIARATSRHSCPKRVSSKNQADEIVFIHFANSLGRFPS